MQKDNNNIVPFNNPLIRFITDNKYRWVRHSLFIIVGILLSFKGDVGHAAQLRPEKLRYAVLLSDSISFIFITSLIYLLLLVLVPKLFFRSKLFLFFASVFAMLVLIYADVWSLDHFIVRPVDPGNSLPHVELSFIHFIEVAVISIVLLGASVGVKVFKKWI